MQNKYQFVSILYIKSHNLTGDTLMFFKKRNTAFMIWQFIFLTYITQHSTM